eukprot:m.213979 g.213979  ORF g.213979 m.213979 type:complete len:502 (-) comp33166_c0_seq1:236-1741(-)
MHVNDMRLNLKLRRWPLFAVAWLCLYLIFLYYNSTPSLNVNSSRPYNGQTADSLCASGTLSALGDVCCPAHCSHCGRHGDIDNATVDLRYIERSWNRNYWGHSEVVTDDRLRYPSEPGCGIRSMLYENRVCNTSDDTACVMPNLHQSQQSQQAPMVSDCCIFFPNNGNASLTSNLTFNAFISKVVSNSSSMSCGLKYSDEFLHYRLGDMVNNIVYRPQIAELHLTNFPNSIATEFVRRYPNNYSLIPELSDIIDSKFPKTKPTKSDKSNLDTPLHETPGNDTVVVHLRTGDLKPLYARRECQMKLGSGPQTDDAYDSVSDPWYCGEFASYLIDSLCVEASYSKYLRPLSYYREIIDILREKYPHVRKVVLNSGLHVDFAVVDYDMCCANIAAVRLLFETFGYAATVRLSSNPDADIAFMSRASFFVESGGGYSRTVSKLVMYNKGVVFMVADWYYRRLCKGTTSPKPHGVLSCDVTSKVMVRTSPQIPPPPPVLDSFGCVV